MGKSHLLYEPVYLTNHVGNIAEEMFLWIRMNFPLSYEQRKFAENRI
jgi:hypothetical protein